MLLKMGMKKISQDHLHCEQEAEQERERHESHGCLGF